jgi:hypothetical protein
MSIFQKANKNCLCLKLGIATWEAPTLLFVQTSRMSELQKIGGKGP